MTILKGRQRCFTCPKMMTTCHDDLDTYYPVYDTSHDCYYTGRDVTKNVEDRTINKYCPLWINQWPE